MCSLVALTAAFISMMAISQNAFKLNYVTVTIK